MMRTKGYNERIFLLNEYFQLILQFFSPALKNFLRFEETVIMFYETESDEVLANALVLLTEEGRRRNSLKLPVLAQPFSKPVISGGVSFRAEVNLVRQPAPVSHHEVAALGYDGLHPDLGQHLRQEVSLLLQVH